MRILTEQDVLHLLDADLALAAAEEAYRLHAVGSFIPPGRIDLRPVAGGALTLSAVGPDDLLGVKTNVHAVGVDGIRRHGSLVTLWDLAKCRPLMLAGGLAFNRRRTAAGFAVAVRRLAAAGASTLTVFGAGAMAPESIRLACAVRSIRRVLIVGRTAGRAEALAVSLSALPELSHVQIDAASDADDAASAADIIVAVTSSETPVVRGAAVRPGTLVVLGGANRPTAREADDGLMLRATVYADHLQGCLERSGDIILALESGALSRRAIAGEIGAVLDGEPEVADVTVFKSIGIAMQDIVLARRLLERAQASNIGLVMDLAGGSPGNSSAIDASQVVASRGIL